MERGLASTEVATDGDSDSSSFVHSIHLCSFVFHKWNDSRGHHGTACAHGCSLDTLNDELCQVNTRVSRIARWQAAMGGFTAYTSPSPPISKDESDDGSSSDDANEDDGASSPNDDEMSTWFNYPLSLVTKKGSSFDMRVVIYIGGVSIGDFWDRGNVYTMRDVVRFLCIFFSFFYIYLMYIGLMTIWHKLYLLIFGFIYVNVYYSLIFTRVVSFLSLCTCFLYVVCNILFLFHTKMPWWVLFKVFQKYRLSKSSCPKLSSCKVFQKFVLW